MFNSNPFFFLITISFLHLRDVLPVDFFKWSLVVETRVPDLVDDFGGLDVVFTRWSVHDGLDGSHPDAVLELLGEGPVSSGYGFSRPAAFTAEHGGSDLFF